MKTLNEYIVSEYNEELVDIIESFFASDNNINEGIINASWDNDYIVEGEESKEQDAAALALKKTFNNAKGGLAILAKQANVDRETLKNVVEKICRKLYVTDNVSVEGEEVDDKKLAKAQRAQSKNLEALMGDEQAIMGLSAILCGALLMNDSNAKGSKKAMVKVMESLSQIITKQKKNLGVFLGLREKKSKENAV